MIFYYNTDYNKPSGGMWACYRHVDVLNEHGIDAAVLHVEPGFRVSWFKNATRVENMKEVVAHPDDIVVISSIIEHRWQDVFPGLRKVIFNQGAYLTFHAYPLGYAGKYHYEDALGTIVVSEDSEHYLRCAFPDIPIFRTVYGIDPNLFYYESAIKKDQIAFVPARNPDEAKQVLCILTNRGMRLPLVPIHDKSREDAARILRESRYFLSFGFPEGFGLPPCEAMACGCIVIGYHAMGGREFLRAPYAFPVGQGDVIEFVESVERVLAEDHAATARAAAEFIAGQYSPVRERESIIACWHRLLGA